MIIDTKKNTLESNVASTGTFKIATTAKAFEILSSGLYSDKIKAIIRELSTNAEDSHVGVKQSKPFDVHLPTFAEPWFAIRDYGSGISPKNIKSIYTTYFDSDKTDSNDFNGCLGLGSKSPFAYTDQFTVTSFYKNKKIIYTCYSDEKGLPNIAELSQEDTSEHNGLEVKFTVDNKDCNSFAEKAVEVYKWFENKPKLNKNLNLNINFLKKSGSWAIKDNNYSNYSSLIMGNVEYPLTTDAFTTKVKNQFTSQELEIINSNSIVLWCNIGDVDFAASREKLQFTEKTISSIKEQVSKVRDELISNIQKEIETAKNLWDARVKLSVFLSKQGILNSLIKGHVFNWKNEKVTNLIVATNKEAQPIAKITLLERTYSYKTGKYYYSEKDMTHLTIQPGMEIWVNDVSKNGLKMVKNYLEQKNIQSAYFIRKVKDHDFNVFLDKNGLNDLQKTSSIQDVKIADKKKTAKILKLTGTFYNSFAAFEEHEVDLDKGGIYIEVHGVSWKTSGLNKYKDFQSTSSLGTLLEFYKFIDPSFNFKDIVAFRQSSLESIKGNKKWIPLGEYIETNKQKLIADRVDLISRYLTIKQAANDSIAKHYFDKTDYYFNKIVLDLSDTNLLKQVYNKWNEIALTKKELDEVQSIIKSDLFNDLLQNSSNSIKVNADFIKLIERVNNEYPLLADVHYYHHDKKTKEKLLRYIALEEKYGQHV